MRYEDWILCKIFSDNVIFMSLDYVFIFGFLVIIWIWFGFSRVRLFGSGRWGLLVLWGVISWLRNIVEVLILGFFGIIEIIEW